MFFLFLSSTWPQLRGRALNDSRCQNCVAALLVPAYVLPGIPRVIEIEYPLLFSETLGAKKRTMQRRLPMEIIDLDMARVLAQKTEAERLQIGWGMQRFAVRMITRVLRAEYPDWTEEEVSREVARRISRGG